ncbi:MAG: hypothetical protein SOW50_05885, partial [Lachnospiraceae bacterium]|nr:hypothetical protein [Lachnospiraceae bacterium]
KYYTPIFAKGKDRICAKIIIKSFHQKSLNFPKSVAIIWGFQEVLVGLPSSLEEKMIKVSVIGSLL